MASGDHPNRPGPLWCPGLDDVACSRVGRSLTFISNTKSEAVTSIDSSGIQWLLKCRQAVHQARGQLVLQSIPPCVAAPLRLLGLLPALTTADNS